MAACKAGNCSKTCDNGCGCIAETANPANCNCFCSGGSLSSNTKLEPATLVNVSISELPFPEAARFLNDVHTESIIVPTDKLSEQVSLNLESRRFVDVLSQLGLTTSENIERGKRRMGLLMFFAGFVIGALIFSLIF